MAEDLTVDALCCAEGELGEAARRVFARADDVQDAATVDRLARFLYEHRAGGDESGPWTDRRREFYRAFASDILGYLGQPRWGEVREGHYRGLDWDDPERSGTFCGNCMEPWPCPFTREQFGSSTREESP